MSKSLRENVHTIILIGILLFSALLMFNSAIQESAIMDELAHIPAGYSYVKYFDYRLNPEHPPVVKSLSALPLLLLDLNFPTDKNYWENEVNPQWIAGNDFIYHYNGKLGDKIILFSRIFPILLTLLLIVFVYIWARQLIGKKWALLPAFLVALSPNFLAHGHYVTTDIGAAFGFILGMFFFSKALMYNSKKNVILSGIFFGISQLLKFSTVLLLPIFAIMILFKWWGDTYRSSSRIFSKNSLIIFWNCFRTFLITLIIGYLIVWAVYFVFTINYPINKQVSDTKVILGSFAGGETPNGLKTCLPQHLSMRCLAEINIWMSGIPVLRALGQYMLGVLMVIQRSSGGNTAYFLGKVGGGGWWYYFPLVFLLKETIPALIIIFGGLLAAIGRIISNLKKSTSIKRIRDAVSTYLELYFAESSMIIMVVFYWLYSIRSPLNIGFRHIMPILPFIYILSSVSIKKFTQIHNVKLEGGIFSVVSGALKAGIRLFAKYLVLLILALWILLEVLYVTPYYLSYYNELGGGVWNGYKYATDSNYDWGQDLKRLRDYVYENNIDKIAVDYFGGGDVKYYLGDRAVLWDGSKDNPINHGIKWLAVSINTMASAKAPAYRGFKKDNPNAYSYIKDFENPYNRAGTSIFIYKLGL